MARSHVFFADSLVPSCRSVFDRFVVVVVFFFHRVLIVRKRPTLLKLLCGLAVLISLFVCLIPTIFPSVDPKAEKTKTTETDGVSRVMWPVIFMLGFVSTLYIYRFWLLPCASVSNRILVQSLSYENECRRDTFI